MKQITNHLIEIGSNFRNAAFRKTARNKYLFSEEINVWYPAALASQETEEGLAQRLSVFRGKLLDQSVFLSETSFLGRCQGSEQERFRC